MSRYQCIPCSKYKTHQCEADVLFEGAMRRKAQLHTPEAVAERESWIAELEAGIGLVRRLILKRRLAEYAHEMKEIEKREAIEAERRRSQEKTYGRPPMRVPNYRGTKNRRPDHSLPCLYCGGYVRWGKDLRVLERRDGNGCQRCNERGYVSTLKTTRYRTIGRVWDHSVPDGRRARELLYAACIKGEVPKGSWSETRANRDS